MNRPRQLTMDLINHLRKVPQTDQGIEMLRNAMVDPLEVSAEMWVW